MKIKDRYLCAATHPWTGKPVFDAVVVLKDNTHIFSPMFKSKAKAKEWLRRTCEEYGEAKSTAEIVPYSGNS